MEVLERIQAWHQTPVERGRDPTLGVRLACGIAQFDPPELGALKWRSDLGRRTDDNDGLVLWIQALAGGPRHCLLGDRLHPILVGRVVVDWQSLRPHARAGTRRLVVAR